MNNLDTGDITEFDFLNTGIDSDYTSTWIEDTQQSEQKCSASLTLYSTVDGEAVDESINEAYLAIKENTSTITISSGFNIWLNSEQGENVVVSQVNAPDLVY